jgi:DNA polymerase III epsilon subunit-like protein
MTVKRFGLTHLNDHLLCAVDTETTGRKPGFHDLIQICVLPLNAELKPAKEFQPFYTELQLKRPENVDPDAMRKNRVKICTAQTNGLDPDQAADLFDEWFKALRLPSDKRIVPLAHNWPFDRGFIVDWLGDMTVEHLFDGRFRDTMAVANFMNDRADFQVTALPFSKVDLPYMCATYKIPHERAHDALQDCLATAELYRQMCCKY